MQQSSVVYPQLRVNTYWQITLHRYGAWP